MACAAVRRSESVKEMTKEEKSMDNFLLTITCPVCFHYYREPTNFPSCPHTLCRECIQQLKPISLISPDDYECPVCRTINHVPKNFNLPVNSVIRQIVEMVEIQEKAEVAKDSGRPGTFSPVKSAGDGVLGIENEDKCIHYLFPISNKEKCLHCDRFFCESCRFVHAEKLKQKLGRLSRKWENDQSTAASSSELNNLYSEIASELNDNVQEVKKQVSDVVESVIGKFRVALNEKAQVIIAEADSFRSEQLNVVNRAIEAGRFDKSIVGKIDDFLKKSVLETNLNEVSSLIEQASQLEMELKILEVLKNTCHGDKIVFTADDKGFEDFAKEFVRNIDIGWVHVDGDQLLIGHPENKEKPSSEAKIEEKDDDEQDAEHAESADMTVLSSIKLEDCYIKQVIGIVGIPSSDYFIIADGRSFLTVFRARGDKLAVVCTLSVCDPDVSKPNFRQYFSGEMAADDKKLYLIDADQHRIVDVPIPWPILENLKSKTRRSLNNTKVFTRGESGYRGLALNLERNELYTVEDDVLLAFCMKTNIVKFTFRFDQNTRLLAANNAFGFIMSRDDGTICVKSQTGDGEPAPDDEDDLYFSENDFDGGLNAERFSTMASGQVDVDANGNVYFADLGEERIAVCCHVNSVDGEDFNSWVFKTAKFAEKKKKARVISVKPSAIVALSENSLSEPPDFSVVAAIDSTTDSVLLLKLPLSG